jgi:hypothetical protein
MGMAATGRRAAKLQFLSHKSSCSLAGSKCGGGDF